MAAGEVFPISFVGMLESPSPSLQNSIKFSYSGRYFSALCDFGVVQVCQLKDIDDNFMVTPVKRLTFDKGEHLESHTWSSDDEIFAVAGHKIYLFEVLKDFSSLRIIPLYYMPKDISLIMHQNSSSVNKLYSLAVAGPNGVELYQMKTGDPFSVEESSSLHSDLAIGLVRFSPDERYLAVAALDGHFGIWTVSSLDTDQKEFWYVHLKTVRITSMKFSPDSSMVAVAGWEGSWHSYRKKFQSERLLWEEFHHSKTSDRVSGNLPGSLLSWSPDNRFIRLTLCKDNKSYLSTFDTQTSASTVTPLDGIVKGLASFRGRSCDYSLCFLRSKKCFAVPWPIDENDPVQKIASASKQPRKLLQEEESLEGSIAVERSADGGVTLKWRRISRNILSLLRDISKRQLNNTGADQPPNAQPCHSIHYSGFDSELKQDEFGLRNLSHSGDGIKKTQDGDEINSHGKTVDDSCKTIELNSAEALARLDFREIKHSRLNDTGDSLYEMSLNVLVGDIASDIPQEDMSLLTKEVADEGQNVEAFPSSEISPTNKCHFRTNKEYVPCMDRTLKASDEFSFVQAPFINPKLFQGSCLNDPSFLSDSSTQLLNSTNYIVVAVLPLLAYVYHRTSEEWRTLLFSRVVKCCCISNDKYMALLTNDGGIRIWCLETMKMLCFKDEVLCDSESEPQRFIISGNPFEPQFNIIRLNKTGCGKIIRICFQPDHGGACLTVNRLRVCYPDLLSHACSTKLCGSIGHMIIFKQGSSEDHQHRTAGQECDDSIPSKWIVIVPELGISQNFVEDRECSLEGFVIRHHNDLCRLSSLAAMKR